MWPADLREPFLASALCEELIHRCGLAHVERMLRCEELGYDACLDLVESKARAGERGVWRLLETNGARYTSKVGPQAGDPEFSECSWAERHLANCYVPRAALSARFHYLYQVLRYKTQEEIAMGVQGVEAGFARASLAVSEL